MIGGTVDGIVNLTGPSIRDDYRMSRGDETQVDSTRSLYTRHRYPAEIIAHCVWLYYRFALSLRDVEELMLARGIVVSHETIRAWCAKFGPEYARGLRRRAPEPGDKWFLDEVFVKIGGVRQYLWRAVDQEGNVLDVLVQSRRSAKAAAFFRQADAQAGPGTEGAGDRQARQLRGGASGVDAIGRTPVLEVSQQPGRELAPTHQTARTGDEVFPLTGCSATVPGGVQRDLAALPARPTQARRERLPLRNDRPIRHVERRDRCTRSCLNRWPINRIRLSIVEYC